MDERAFQCCKCRAKYGAGTEIDRFTFGETFTVVEVSCQCGERWEVTMRPVEIRRFANATAKKPLKQVYSPEQWVCLVPVKQRRGR